MNLEKLAIALRPRNSWEAFDLGIRLTLQNARAVYLPWLIVMIPAALLIFGVIGWGMDSMSWAGFIMWWLRPAFDRIVLHVISHTVFGEAPGTRDALRAIPRLLRSTALFSALSWRRFDPRRSLRLPIDVLEGLRGKAASQRRGLIARRVSGAALWQTVAFSWLELLLSLGLMLLFVLMIPNELLEHFQWDELFAGTESAQIFTSVWTALLLLCHLCLEPLYVAGGFMLYLKRRNDLEAWDVELQFRRLTQAHQNAHGIGGTLAAIALCICMSLASLIALSPGNATAQQGNAQVGAQVADSASLPAATSAALDDEDEEMLDEEVEDSAPAISNDPTRRKQISDAPERVVTIMQGPDFGASEPHHTLRWREKKSESKPWNLPDWLEGWAKAFARVFGAVAWFLAQLGRVGGWLLIAAIAAAVLFVIVRYSGRWQSGTRRAPPPAELAGFDIRPQSLPGDVAAAAKALLAEGKSREALSLLFRGALSALAWRDHVPFARGDTEGDCLDRVRQHAPPRFMFLARLLSAWQQLAYAHRTPSNNEISTLCDEWPRHFALAAGSTSGADNV